MSARWPLVLVAVVAAFVTLSSGADVQSTTRVNHLEVLGTGDVSGESVMRSGARLSSTGGPLFTSGVGDPNGVETATRGSLWLRSDTAQVYQNTDGAQAWSQVGTGGGLWQLVVDDSLTGGTLTGWSQRDCAWTAESYGFQTLGGASECYLSYESGGVENAPFSMLGVMMEFEAAFASTATTSNQLGAVISGQSGSVTAGGTLRVALRRDGAVLQASAYPVTSVVIDPALGTIPVDTWFTLKIVALGDVVSVWVNGTFYATFSVDVTFPGTRVGLWGVPAMFRNLKIYRMRDES